MEQATFVQYSLTVLFSLFFIFSFFGFDNILTFFKKFIFVKSGFFNPNYKVIKRIDNEQVDYLISFKNSLGFKAYYHNTIQVDLDLAGDGYLFEKAVFSTEDDALQFIEQLKTPVITVALS